jgi:hypothetical protein
MLSVDKQKLVQYMTEKGLEWREDISNTERKYKRNVVRLDVIPVMSLLAGGEGALKKRLDALGEQSAAMRRWIDAEATTFITQHATLTVEHPLTALSASIFSASVAVSSGAPFRKLPSPLVQTDVLLRLCRHVIGAGSEEKDSETVGYEMAKRLLRLALEELGAGRRQRSVQINEDVLATRMGGILLIRSSAVGREIVKEGAAVATMHGVRGHGSCSVADEELYSPYAEGLEQQQKATCTGVTIYHRQDIAVRVVAVEYLEVDAVEESHGGRENTASRFLIASSLSSDINGSNSAMRNVREVSLTLCGVAKDTALRVRLPRPGDRFRPYWRGSAIGLSEFLRGQKVPLHLRGSVLVVEDVTSGVIVGVPPVASAAWRCVDNTRIIADTSRACVGTSAFGSEVENSTRAVTSTSGVPVPHGVCLAIYISLK